MRVERKDAIWGGRMLHRSGHPDRCLLTPWCVAPLCSAALVHHRLDELVRLSHEAGLGEVRGTARCSQFSASTRPRTSTTGAPTMTPSPLDSQGRGTVTGPVPPFSFQSAHAVVFPAHGSQTAGPVFRTQHRGMVAPPLKGLRRGSPLFDQRDRAESAGLQRVVTNRGTVDMIIVHPTEWMVTRSSVRRPPS